MSDNQNTSHDNGIAYGIMLAMIIIACIVIWYFRSAEIRNFIRWLRYGELWLMHWFISDSYTVPFQGGETLWQEGFKAIPTWTKNGMENTHLTYMNALFFHPMRYMYVLIGIAGGLWCLTKGPHTDFRSTLNISSLIDRQALTFPVIQPFVEFNPSDQPPRPPGAPVPADLPLFAEALGPEEWIAYNVIPIPDGKIDESAAAKAFIKQLKGRWRGVKKLKPYQQVLMAVFCLKASRKRDQADDMLGRIALCWSAKDGLKLSKDKTLVKEAREVLANKSLSKQVISDANRHAFITTAMLRALQTARNEGGVLAPATFVWLRGHDRTLWYPMNNLGRHSNHTEAMGAMAHFRQEKLTNRPIPVPKVEDAVSSIVEYMGSVRARPIPKLDYKNSKKRGIKKAK